MDPLSALSVAGCVVQFVDYCGRLLKDASEIQKSATGQSTRHVQLSEAATHLSYLVHNVEQKLGAVSHTSLSQSEKAFLDLCEDCNNVKDDLVEILGKAYDDSDGGHTRVLSSFLTAVKASTAKGKIEALGVRISELRERMIATVLMILWDDARASNEGAIRFAEQQGEILASLKCLTGNIDDSNVVNSLGRPGSLGIKQEFESFIKTTWSPQIHLDNIIPDVSDSPLTPKQLQAISHAILRSLYHESMRWREQSIPDAHRETFRWMLKKPRLSPSGDPLWSDFPEWLSKQSHDIYWVAGKPGAGKSTLMRFLINEPSFRSGICSWAGSANVVVAYFYSWNSGVAFQKTQEGLLRTLLFQCLSKMPELIPRIYPRRFTLLHAFGSTLLLPAWTLAELLTSLSTLLATSGHTFKIALMIDGLDELEGDHYDLVKLLKEAVSHDGIKLCISSRIWNVFNDAFKNGPRLKLEDLTRPDIEAFVNHELHSSEAFRDLKDMDPKTAGELLAEIVEKSQGVFLWVDLVVQTLLRNLADGSRLHELRKTLDELPDDLYDLYERIWSRIESRYQPEASEILQYLEATKKTGTWLSIMTLWLSSSEYPVDFDIDSLTDAGIKGSVKMMTRRLNSRTKGLLELSPGDSSFGDRVDYLHRTAREWVLVNQTRLFPIAPTDFDCYLTLLKSNAIQLPLWLVGDSTLALYPNVWDDRIKVLFALAIEARKTNSPQVYQFLETIEHSLSTHTNWCLVGPLRHNKSHQQCFVSFCALVPFNDFVQTKMSREPEIVSEDIPASTHTVLESAIFGYNYKDDRGLEAERFMDLRYGADRLALVEFLLKTCTYSDEFKRMLQECLPTVFHNNPTYCEKVDLMLEKSKLPRKRLLKWRKA